MRKVVAFLFVAALPAAVAAQTQQKKLDVNVGGGYTFALSDIRKYLGDGYNISAGLTYNLTPMIGFQAEYGFTGLGQKQLDIPVTGLPGGVPLNQPFYGDMNMQYGDLNIVLKPSPRELMKPYIIAGVGVYYRPVKVTTPAVGYIPGYCSIWWYWCVPGGYVAVEQVVGTRSSTGFGIDVGGGVNLMVTDTMSVYVEARYHYVWGPVIKNPETNESFKANGQFLPITAGIRF